jgi:hypothetical protein
VVLWEYAYVWAWRRNDDVSVTVTYGDASTAKDTDLVRVFRMLGDQGFELTTAAGPPDGSSMVTQYWFKRPQVQ